jgi:predicted nucleic-acid-binding Zn-ribbon protein
VIENLKKGGVIALIVDGILMNNEKDIFSELEEDISGDWKEIQNKIRAEEFKEKRKVGKPKRPHFPSFNDFYDILLDIAYETNESEALRYIQRLVRRVILVGGNEPLPKSIEKIWEALCNPRDFGCDSIPCRGCSKRYDITYKIEYEEDDYHIDDYLNDGIDTRTVKYISVYCPSCGYNLLHLANAELVSVSLSSEDTYDEHNRRERRWY